MSYHHHHHCVCVLRKYLYKKIKLLQHTLSHSHCSNDLLHCLFPRILLFMVQLFLPLIDLTYWFKWWWWCVNNYKKIDHWNNYSCTSLVRWWEECTARILSLRSWTHSKLCVLCVCVRFCERKLKRSKKKRDRKEQETTRPTMEVARVTSRMCIDSLLLIYLNSIYSNITVINIYKILFFISLRYL